MLSGDTSSPPGVIGPPHPRRTRPGGRPRPPLRVTPRPSRPGRPTAALGVVPGRPWPRVGCIARSHQGPAEVDEPGRHLGAADVDGEDQICHRTSVTRLGDRRVPCAFDAAPCHGSAEPRDRAPRRALSPRAGGSESGTSRGPRSPLPRSRSTPRLLWARRPWTASGRASRPGPCGAGSARTTRRRRT